MNGLRAAKLRVMEAVPYVQKRQEKGELRYTYVGEVELIEALRPAMIAEGLALRPTRIGTVEHGTYTTRSGAVMQCRVAPVDFELTHTSGESELVCVLAEASDNSDKSAPKLMTIAFKYALRQCFMIETGDDPDEVRNEREFLKDSNLLLNTAATKLNGCKTIDELDKQMASILDAEEKAKFTPEHLTQLQKRCDDRRASLMRKGGGK